MDLSVIFAAVVTTLAALAVIGALVFVIVAEFVAIRAKLVAHETRCSGRSMPPTTDGSRTGISTPMA